MWKPPRNEKEVRRIVRQMAEIEKWQPGSLHEEIDQAIIATILHRFGAEYLKPPRIKEMMSRPEG